MELRIYTSKKNPPMEALGNSFAIGMASVVPVAGAVYYGAEVVSQTTDCDINYISNNRTAPKAEKCTNAGLAEALQFSNAKESVATGLEAGLAIGVLAYVAYRTRIKVSKGSKLR